MLGYAELFRDSFECHCEDVCGRKGSDQSSGNHTEQAAAAAPAAAAELEPGGGGGTAGKSNSASGSIKDGWRSSPHAVPTNYTPSLLPRELEKGIVSYGEGSRARRWAHKLLSGQPVSVALLGGSITQGSGSSPPHLGMYALRVLRWINETFPNPKHVLRNSGHGAVPSSYFSMCVSREAPLDADLVIFEFNMNDGGPLGSPMRRAHERLVRKVLNLPNRPAAVELVFWGWPALDFNDSRLPVPWQHSHDEILGDFAQYYRLPWLGLRSLLWDGFNVTRAVPAERSQPGKFDNFFLDFPGGRDNQHPNDNGHRVMADLVIHWMQRVLEDVAAHPLEAWDEQEAQRPLPIPMQQDNWEASSSNTCIMGDEVKAAVTRHDDAWQWVDEGKPGRPPKWGWVSTQPGSSLQLTLNASKPRAGPEERVTLGVAHLKSYEHMGKFSVACVEGCSCDLLIADGHGTEKWSQLNFAMLLATPADACKLKLTVLDDTQSGEHKVKLLGVVLSEDTGFLISDERVRVAAVTGRSAGPARVAGWRASVAPCSAKQRKSFLCYGGLTTYRATRHTGQVT
ncbi:hypothetical protein ABPG77_000600 [Micractinium sp. CCAP 211/92]